MGIILQVQSKADYLTPMSYLAENRSFKCLKSDV